MPSGDHQPTTAASPEVSLAASPLKDGFSEVCNLAYTYSVLVCWSMLIHLLPRMLFDEL